jgi:hypothetical protein
MYGTDPNDGQNAHTSLVSFRYRSSICVINASHISLSSRHYTDKSLVCAMRLPSSRLSAVFLLIVLCPKNISVYYVICVKAISSALPQGNFWPSSSPRHNLPHRFANPLSPSIMYF